MMRCAIVCTLLASLGCFVESQQSVKLSTSSAKFRLSFTSEQGKTFSTKQHFQFESATAKLFHKDISAQNVTSDPHAVVTSVHVEHMENADGVGESPASLTLDSIVSVTFSEVGLAGAIITTNPGESGGDVSNLASTLTKAVSSEDVMKALMNEGLVTDDTELLTLSFSQFDGTSEERGIFSTETEIVTKRKNDGWPMFFAGVMLSVLLVSIWLVGSWIYQKEQLDKSPSSEKQSSCRSVYYDGDVDLEDATTASGVLGLKGHHPVATQDENAHPNRMNRRKRRGGSSSHKTGATDDSSQCDAFSPMSQRTAASASSKQPLGITSMRKLSTFLTPQKPKSNRVNVYDIERLTYT